MTGDKKILFITTKNTDYIRNSQEIALLSKHASKLKVIGSDASGYCKRLFQVYGSLIRENCRSYDVVFIGFAPQLVLPFFRRKFRNGKVVIDFFISLYDTFVCDRKMIKKGTPAAAILHWIDKRTLNLADHIIVDTKAHGGFFASEFCAAYDKMEVLYLEADRTIYYPRSPKSKRYPDKYTVLYFGIVLPLQGVETVIKAAELLGDHDKIQFIVIGPEKKGVARYMGNNIQYMEWLSQQELADEIAGADLCLAGHFNADIDKAKRTIPGKAYIYEAMQKKMILGDNEANHELFKSDNMHYYVEMGNAESLAALIVRIAEEQRMIT